ncbi:ribonuclease D [Propionibacterium cyclohexanicum]|uniref:Ribonuclease D n=1 Tax=Propionibacterium cyclohexanicum TaxID=64702 RepID=A0A1H9QQ86_9ACTN|nr:HRDC domain-containing protein [Propionibacterium cyclohexanicum]SER61999.1 ribonuclease D [Propionibacterium cyclohexanicum]
MSDALTVDHEIDEDSGLPILSMPRDGLPALVDTPQALDECIASLGSGSGPVAIDTERAQSFRYSAKAYLLQFRRAGSGTWLIDPEAFEPAPGTVSDLGALREALASAEWIIHAATQDLPCLVELGLWPHTLFDTELAGRLLGLDHVGLGHMVEHYFGLHLLKEHSAADWSTRPLPRDWIAYAALDVELLVELRDKIRAELAEVGKLEWAAQEFAHLARACRLPVPARKEPWRRTHGTHTVHSRRGLALVRALWTERDEIARALDKAPGKIVPDKAITELAAKVVKDDAPVPGARELDSVMGFHYRIAKQHRDRWLKACEQTAALPAGELPSLHAVHDGPPQPRSWQRTRPEAWDRWQRIRPAANALAEQLVMPSENLVSPDALRRLAWDPLPSNDEQSIDARLAEYEVRPWQRALLDPVLGAALRA